MIVDFFGSGGLHFFPLLFEIALAIAVFAVLVSIWAMDALIADVLIVDLSCAVTYFAFPFHRVPPFTQLQKVGGQCFAVSTSNHFSE